MLFPCCLFMPRFGNVNTRHSRRRVQADVPLLAPWKALRWQGQASSGSVPGSDVSALRSASSIPLEFMAVEGREVPNAPASPPPNPTPSAGVVLSEAEVEKSMQEGMAALEQLSRFGPDPAHEGALP
jgi:hypothetical protein